MMLARVAGVPRPASFMASAASSSSTSLPAVSMAFSRLPSLKRAGGLVLLASASARAQVSTWPTSTDGSVRSFGSASPSSVTACSARACFSTRWRRMASTAYQPGSTITVPLLRNVLPATSVMIVVSSSLAGGRNTARNLRATMS